MATDLERLVVQLSADVKGYQNALNRAQGMTNRQARAIESRFKKMNSNISSSFQNTLSSSVAAIGGALGVSEITRYADAWTEAGNKINAAAQSAGVQARSLEDLTKGANDARASLTDYADLYARLTRSASNVAKNEQEIATATNVVAKAFKAGGAAASEQAAGILQLGQALGSGVLQGDELRSLRENAPILADAIAKEFGVTIAGLKKLGSEGKLTSDRVFKAILNAQAPIEAQFAKTNATIADSFTKLKNNLTQYIGQTSEAYGITQTIGQIMGALAGNISSVANAAAAAGAVLLATFGRGAAFASVAALANPFVALAAAVGAAAFAVTQLWDEIVPLQGSFATLGDYANAMWQMLSAGAESAKASITSAFDQVLSTINGVLEGTGVSFSGLGDIVKFFVNNTIENFVRMKDIIVATFTIVPSAIGEAVVGAMNAMIAGVEAGINRVISAVNSAVASINSLSEYAGVSPIGQVGPIDLDRIVNEYEGAGKKAAEAFNDAVTREAKDYVGAAGDAITSTVDKAVGAVTAKANEIARARRELIKDAGLGGPVESGVTNTTGFGGGIGGAGDGSSGGSGKKGRGSKQNEYQREIEQIQKRTAALQAETLAQSAINPLINDYGYAVEYAAAKHDLLTAAQEAGLAITPELEANIDKLAMAYGNAVVESERLAESQDKLKQAADDFKSSAKDITSGFISDIRGGASAAEALSNALGKVLDKVIDIGLNSIFGLGGGGGGGGLFGGLLKVFGLKDGGLVHAATGGRIQGPGTGRSDSIPAMLSNGEFVVNAAATKKYAGLLEAINGGKAIKLANGGYANPSAPTLPTMNKSSFGSSSKDVVTVVLQDDSGRMASIADQRIQTASGTIVKVAVTQANKSAPAAMAQYQQKTAGGDYRN